MPPPGKVRDSTLQAGQPVPRRPDSLDKAHRTSCASRRDGDGRETPAEFGLLKLPRGKHAYEDASGVGPADICGRRSESDLRLCRTNCRQAAMERGLNMRSADSAVAEVSVEW